ncbi:Na(+)-translocating NADH-quinone reductase subunit C [Gammaproteobacteria bacterium 45_16_T64]|nr:Na(+)-translocating NADH-quinone reductase subunit C [Gammaproteobacteria bacterium 45_16_T64]
MSNDSTGKTLTVAFVLCIICSIVVSTAAVVLKPLQLENKLLDKKQNILAAAGLLKVGESVDESFKNIDVKIVERSSGNYLASTPALEGWEKAILANPEAYDQRKAAKTIGQFAPVGAGKDIASIRKQAKYATVYHARNDAGEVEAIILPVHGYGLWSTLYGFIALETDLSTVVGMGFYEHAETPGLGGEVDNPKWKGLWPSKQVFDADGVLKIEVIKGSVTSATPDSQHKIDGLAGATLTSRGVSNLVNFWLGKDGFGPYLAKLKAEGV